MPFDPSIPRPLMPVAVRTYAPDTSGVYGISSASEWIYIGASDDIRGALLAHLQQSDTPVMKRQPTGFVFEVCEPAQRGFRQNRLIAEYSPICNGPLPRQP